ncbi:ROK family protein [Candidatus Woesearchaeota archaeon]|nr:ROK family protein [Candidatus Woesearchaeota archaeon]
MADYIGVDIGGTSIKACKVTLTGHGSKIKHSISGFSETPTYRLGKTKNDFIQNIVEIIESLYDSSIKGIGMGFPTAIRGPTKPLYNFPNIPYKKVDIHPILAKKFRKPIMMDNDASCYILGEAIVGAGKKYRHVIGITLGTGIGGGIVTDKKLFRGRYTAGEFGHMTIKYDGPQGYRNNPWEEIAAKRGIIKIAKKNKLDISEPKELYDLAVKGNKTALKCFEEYGEILGIGITNLIYALDPEVVIIGGKISKSFRYFSKTLKSTIKERSYMQPVIILKASLGQKAAVIGASLLLMSHNR